MAIRDDEFETIGRFVGDKVRALQKRIQELEERPALVFAGTWRKGKKFKAGDCCQHGGSLWLCIHPDPDEETPGKTSFWRLLVKSGAAK